MNWTKFEIIAAVDVTTDTTSKDAEHRIGRVVEVNKEWLVIGKAFTLYDFTKNTHSRTSMVQKINESTDEKLDFETMNTRYVLQKWS